MTCDFPIEIYEKYAVWTSLGEPEVHLLGAGAYGEVFLVRRVGAEESTLALKRCFDCLVLDDPTTLKRTYREIAVLRQARHTNIVALKDIVLPKTGCDLYLVFELASQDLERAIRYNLLDEISRRRVSYDVASALSFLHRCGLMHRDVKPSNILLDDSGRAKLCDFGFVRHVSCVSSAKTFTEYVGMRWYRAPELLLGSTSYNQNIDVTCWAKYAKIAFLQTFQYNMRFMRTFFLIWMPILRKLRANLFLLVLSRWLFDQGLVLRMCSCWDGQKLVLRIFVSTAAQFTFPATLKGLGRPLVSGMDAEETSGIVEVLQAMCFDSTCNVHFMEFYARERERAAHCL